MLKLVTFTVNAEYIERAVSVSYNFEGVMKVSNDTIKFWFDSSGSAIDEENEDGSESVIEVVFRLNATDRQKHFQGIHITRLDNEEDLERAVSDALESCFRDGFRSIYIHNKAA